MINGINLASVAYDILKLKISGNLKALHMTHWGLEWATQFSTDRVLAAWWDEHTYHLQVLYP